MLSQNMIDNLNHQINLEFFSSNFYLQMSAWCANHGFDGASQFLLRHADEELEHMQKLFDYVSDAGALPILGQIEAPKTEFDSLEDVFAQILAHEIFITQQVNELVNKTFEDKDQSTFNFLQWFVAEQHEEEKLFTTIISKFKLLGNSGQGIYFIDKELKTL